MPCAPVREPRLRTLLLLGAALAVAACGSGTTVPAITPDTIRLGSTELHSLDSAAVSIQQANPASGDIRSLVDSTILALTAGVELKRVDISTNLTSAPLYMIGIHRPSPGTTQSSATWTLVAIDDPNKLGNLIEVSGFAQASGSTPPSSVSGAIGSQSNIGNGILLQVASGGATTVWRPTSGTATFSSDAAGSACPGFVATAHLSCALETMHVHFTMTAPAGTGGAGARQAALTADTSVPAMRLTYVP